ncbi:acrylyl-CoA reductase (NADPH) [Chitinibacteraceae bacterium HSL-7]
MFRAVWLNCPEDCFEARLMSLDDVMLPDGDVLLEIAYSGLNYKDALAITNRAPVVRQWPMVPGIDGAGTVLESSHPAYKPGDRVLLTGWGMGEQRWGCLSERARVSGDWLVPLPDALSFEDAMTIGTAGLTAMLSVMAIEQHGITPAHGPVLVTGATGGVGSIAVSLLARHGFEVAALTGKADAGDYLQALGATLALEREAFNQPGKPLQGERWAGVIDTCGSHTLANACAQAQYGAAIAACGLAQGMDWPTTVAPFILRGVSLYGIDSVYVPQTRRVSAWQRLSEVLSSERLSLVRKTIGLDDVFTAAGDIMAGVHRGRFVVRVV